jgi:hypothetical protein
MTFTVKRIFFSSFYDWKNEGSPYIPAHVTVCIACGRNYRLKEVADQRPTWNRAPRDNHMKFSAI